SGESLQLFLDAHTWPAYISNHIWEIVAFNDRMHQWFPWIRHGENLMQWIFTPEARTRLHDWEVDWAPRAVAAMRVERARTPNDQRLNRTIASILDRDPDARRLWGESITYVPPDGDRRSLILPHCGGVREIELVTLLPARDPSSRVMMLMPIGAAVST
ncbi:MmyB family transcriptional regulator, partial [Winogradskya humida]|uniref:MmyB family transcriptional regulator n=1 Tax=Winogradskya humida TaxID=113566 RepID=UPI003F693702